MTDRKKRAKKVAALCAATLVLASCSGERSLTNGKPPKQGQTEQVRLVLKGSVWKVQLKGGGEEDPAKVHTKIGKDVGPTVFVVDISGNAATFNNTEPLSVWTGDKNVPQSGINSTQIVGPIVDKDGKRLMFVDLNYGDPVTLNYSLHFNEPGVPAVDPIIDNDGGKWI